MSIHEVEWIEQNTTYRGATLNVAKAVAQRVTRDYDWEYFEGQQRLAERAHVTERTARAALRTLENDGILEQLPRRGQHAPKRWRFVFVPQLVLQQEEVSTGNPEPLDRKPATSRPENHRDRTLYRTKRTKRTRQSEQPLFKAGKPSVEELTQAASHANEARAALHVLKGGRHDAERQAQ